MSSLVEIFGARRLIVDKLLAADKIELSLAKLLILLEDLRPMRSDTI